MQTKFHLRKSFFTLMQIALPFVQVTFTLMQIKFRYVLINCHTSTNKVFKCESQSPFSNSENQLFNYENQFGIYIIDLHWLV